MLNTMPERIYWKHEIKNRAVFWEFSMFDFSVFSLGGIYLKTKNISRCRRKNPMPERTSSVVVLSQIRRAVSRYI